MKKLLNPDGPIYQFLARVFDMMWANILFILCSIPIVTVGASWAALHKVCQDVVFEEEEGVTRRFFETFRENFKQATIVWLLVVFFLGCMLCNGIMIVAYFTGGTKLLLNGILVFLIAIMMSITAYMYPLMVRYTNTLPQHFRNAVVLSVLKLPRTLVMLMLHTLPFWILYFSMSGFIQTLVFWLCFGIAFIVYMDTILLKPTFEKLEEVPEDAEEEN